MTSRSFPPATTLLVAASLFALGAPAREPPAVGEVIVDVYGLPAAPAVPKVAPVHERARQTFATRCAQCHGPAGRGDGPVAKTLQPRPRNFSLAQWQREVTDERIAQVVQMGGVAVGKSPLMPPHPDLKGAELAELIALLRSFHSPAPATVVVELECESAAPPTKKRVRLAGPALRTRFPDVPAGAVRVTGFVDLDGDGACSDEEPTFESPAAPLGAGETSRRTIKLAATAPKGGAAR